MQKTKQTSTKLLVIAITTAAIIAAVTTISLSAATPAFAEIRETCDTSGTCTIVGGTSNRQEGFDTPGGHGGRTVIDSSTTIRSGGAGVGPVEGGGNVGGFGLHSVCSSVPVSACSTQVGGSGLHEKGPGGNSGNAPLQ